METARKYFGSGILSGSCKQLQKKWSQTFRKPPAVIDYYGVNLQLDLLPREMQSVIVEGHYERSEIMIIPDFIDEQDSVLEIGSAVGFIGLYCRKILKVKKLVSVEPNPRTIEYLRKNYALNGIEPFLIPAALTEKDGPIAFNVSDMFWCDSLEIRNDVVGGKEIIVEGLTFQSILNRTGGGVDTIIIDIEGGEKYLLVESIPSYIKKILVEIHPEVIGFRTAHKLIEQLILIGFKIQHRVSNTWAMQREVVG